MFNPFKTIRPQTSDARDELYAWQGEAIVEQAIAPNSQGRVRFRGSYWPAQCVDAISFAPGSVVEVIDCDNLTLIVRAVSDWVASTPESV